VEVPLRDLQPGEVLIRQLYMSVDPAMRPLLSQGYPLGAPLTAFALGQVVQSRNSDIAEGVLVANRLGFRDFAVSDGTGLTIRPQLDGLPLSAWLSVMGNTGFTAYGGLLEIARTRGEDRVFVSTAAGAVGSIAVQIARNLGCEVTGSTGSADKVRWLREVAGIASVINYREEPIGEALRAAMPGGIDVYFDNVGGDHLDAALPLMNTLGRIAVCGMIAGYNRPGAVNPVSNLAAIIYRRVTIRGFVGTDFADQQGQFEAQMAEWIRADKIRWAEDISEGLAAAPRALIGVLRGDNLGKALVRIAEPL
jgi:NADPH-dependent curcumin reductase CurA